MRKQTWPAKKDKANGRSYVDAISNCVGTKDDVVRLIDEALMK
jgi:hypothetical protein